MQCTHACTYEALRELEDKGALYPYHGGWHASTSRSAPADVAAPSREAQLLHTAWGEHLIKEAPDDDNDKEALRVRLLVLLQAWGSEQPLWGATGGLAALARSLAASSALQLRRWSADRITKAPRVHATCMYACACARLYARHSACVCV